MAKKKSGVKVKKPTSVWVKPLKANYKDLFKALGKAVVHGASLNWTEVTKNTVDALAAVGLERDVGETAWLLIHRSVVRALYSLVEENLEIIRKYTGLTLESASSSDAFELMCEKLDAALEERDVALDEDFFLHPKELGVVKDVIRPFAKWLSGVGLTEAQAAAISDRLPSYFVYALVDEWRSRGEEYAGLYNAFKTPFEKASEREQAWAYYSAWLQKQVEEPLFSEAFSLKRVYVPIRAYYEERLTDQQRSTAITVATQPRTRELHHAELLWKSGRLASTVPSDPLEPLDFEAYVNSRLRYALLQAYIKDLKLPVGPIKRRPKRAVSAKVEAPDVSNEERVERIAADLEETLDAWIDKADKKDSKLPLGLSKRRPKRAVSAEEKEPDVSNEERVERIAVDLEEFLDNWVEKADAQDAMRVISGGPGSGKSSFARMFAARQAEKQKRRVLFVPLHRFDLSNDLIDAIKVFVELDGFLPHNPLDQKDGDPRLLIIFDGLDELSMQGKLAAEAAQNFVHEVLRKVDRLNLRDARLKVLITGRDLSVQVNESNLRRPQQILHLLPYYLPRPAPPPVPYLLPDTVDEITTWESSEEVFEIIEVAKQVESRPEFIDQGGAVWLDQRQLWWRAYGEVSGRHYYRMPKELDRGELREVTAQPLLNYLVALSFDSGGMKVSEETNVNSIYDDLLKSVYKRVWANYQHPALEGIQQDQFVRILEEIAIATWHSDGRSATLKQIETQCDKNGLRPLLEKFKVGAKEGVSRLLMAFYFRQSQMRLAYDETFEFTHKSFGEYLTARRVVRGIQRIDEALQHRSESFETGWDEREALTFWLNICGPKALDEYLINFIQNEINLNDQSNVLKWQKTLGRLISFALRRGMPTDRLEPRPIYQEEARRARNAEEALLVLSNTCAQRTEVLTEVDWPSSTAFSEWLARLTGQRKDYQNGRPLETLSHINLSNCILILKDLFGADLHKSNLTESNLYEANLVEADLEETILENANLSRADLVRAYLIGSNCAGANFQKANLENSFLQEANFRGATLKGANLQNALALKAFFDYADLEGANLEGINLSGASMQRANLLGASLKGANLHGASLRHASLEGANFQFASLRNANLEGANLKGVRFLGANLHGAYLEGAILSRTTWVDGSVRTETDLEK
jgi:uncharacterized protein YjbI with pentapeptide repeats